MREAREGTYLQEGVDVYTVVGAWMGGVHAAGLGEGEGQQLRMPAI